MRPPASLSEDFTAGSDAVRQAYERGREDERRRRKDSPILIVLVAILALVGAGFLTATAMTGSLAGGGLALDKLLSELFNGGDRP